MATAKPTLETLRARIDEIDEALHDLLMQRAEVVEKIGRSKGGRGPALRPGREAAILRKLATRHRGKLPLSVVVRIWREMIAGYTRMQAPFAAAVYAPEGERILWDIARDHFGSSTPYFTVHSSATAIRAVVEGTATLAVVPWPADEEAEPWWPMLMSEDSQSPRVIGALPFVVAREGEGRQALVIAQIPVEPTGEDNTLIGVDLPAEVSRGRLKDLIEASGLLPTAFWTPHENRAREGGLHLVEVDGYVPADDARLAALAERLEPAPARILTLGSYARPVLIPSPGGRAARAQ